MSTLHCMLENGANLYVKERRRYNTIALGLLKKEERMPNNDFISPGAYVNCTI